MYPGLEITPPFFEIGPKAYLYGEQALALARHADALSERYRVPIIFTPQTADIRLLVPALKRVLVFAQHMDSLRVGRGVGSTLPEAIKAAGATGVLLNHAERKLSRSELERTMARADEVGLATMVCADDAEDAEAIARLGPNIIIAESPAQIGAGHREANDREVIAAINERVWTIDPRIRVLHGAGISNGQDVSNLIAAGAQAAGSSSAICLSTDPFAMLEEMIRSVRQAWDSTH